LFSNLLVLVIHWKVAFIKTFLVCLMFSTFKV
jgi:hypothetical protein